MKGSAFVVIVIAASLTLLGVGALSRPLSLGMATPEAYELQAHPEVASPTWKAFFAPLEPSSLGSLRILVFLSTLLSVFLIYLVGRALALSSVQASLLAGVWALSPLRIFSLQSFAMSLVVLPVFLCGILLMLKNRTVVHLFGACILIVFSSFGIEASVACLGGVGLVATLRGRKFLLAAIPVAVVGIVMYTGGFWMSRFPADIYITDLGTVFGVGLFELIVALIVAVISWRSLRVPLVLAASILAGFALPGLLPYAGIVISEGARRFLGILTQRRWHSGVLQRTMLVLFFCSLLFSFLSSATSLARGFPQREEFQQSLEFSQRTSKESKVLVVPQEYGPFYEATAGMTIAAPERDELALVIGSRSLDVFNDFAERESLNYIILRDPLGEEAKDILFILETKGAFMLVYSTPDVQLWSLPSSS